MKDVFSVGDVARLLGVPPRVITDLFYKRCLRDDLCPIVAGRRLVPRTYVELIGRELHRRGLRVQLSTQAGKGGDDA